jgi:hypothetical protein
MHPLHSIGHQMMYDYLLEHLGNLRYVKRFKTCVSGLNALFGVPKLWKWFHTKCIHSTPFDVWLCFGALRKPSACKRCKTCISSLNPLLWSTEVAKMVSCQMHWFYSIWPKMMFGWVLEHLRILAHVKRCKTCVWCAEVTKMISHQMHPFYSIGPQMMYDCLLEHLGKLRCVKICKTCVSGLNALFGVPKLWKWFRTKYIHSTPLDPKWSLVVFWSI